MKRIDRKYLLLLLLGALLLSSDLVLRHFPALNGDALDFARGMGTGILLLTLFMTARQQLANPR